jgi:hypothetical protein
MNPRKQIRNKVFELINDETDFGERVFLSRKVPFGKNDECEKGVILVFIERESAAIFNQAPKEYKKTLTLSVAIIKSLDPEEIEAIEDQLEVIAEQIEGILEKNDTLDELCSECDFQSYEVSSNDEGEFKEGAIKLTYSITYYVEVGKEEADLSEFETSEVKIKHETHPDDFSISVDHQAEE